MLRPPKRSPVARKARRGVGRRSATSSSQKTKYQFRRKKQKSSWYSGVTRFIPFLSPAQKNQLRRSDVAQPKSVRSDSASLHDNSIKPSSVASKDVKVFAPQKSSEKSTQSTSTTQSTSDTPKPERQHKHQVEASVKKLFYSMRQGASRAFGQSSKASNLWQKIGIFVQSIFENILQFFRYWSLRFDFLRRANVLLSSILLGGVVLAALYISFVDTYFLVKRYQVEFASGSYLSEEDTHRLLQSFQQNSLLGVLPGNQFWYLNNQHLTSTAQSLFPDIEYVFIRERQWPDTAVLEVKMQPILLTLHIDQDQYWRISHDGDVLTRDDIRLKERLVLVQNEIVINSRDPDIFQQYSFQNDLIQREKFWFIDWLWRKMDEVGVRYAETEIISLYDTDVIVRTAAGTELRFDSRGFSPSAQQTRLTSVLGDTTIADQERDGQIAYIDFRTTGKVFVCRRGSVCE